MPGIFRNYPNGDLILGIRARITVLHKNIIPLQIGLNAQPNLMKFFLAKRPVYLAPPNIFFRRRLFYNEFIVG